MQKVGNQKMRIREVDILRGVGILYNYVLIKTQWLAWCGTGERPWKQKNGAKALMPYAMIMAIAWNSLRQWRIY